jgi:hypothetical protein
MLGAPGRLASIVPRAAKAPADDWRSADLLSAVANAQWYTGSRVVIDARPGHWQYPSGGLTAQRTPRQSLLLGQGHIPDALTSPARPPDMESVRSAHGA